KKTKQHFYKEKKKSGCVFGRLWSYPWGLTSWVPKEWNESSETSSRLIHFILLFSRQGKLRLQKWYTTLPDKERKKITREIVQIILSRGQRTSSFIDWKELKLVYKRSANWILSLILKRLILSWMNL
uniref:Adaptor related protein complex 1 subunit sigma 3 n=1 Tax=Sus scrofa TaxID=9823 RepID=A0A8D1UKU7_PIG